MNDTFLLYLLFAIIFEADMMAGSLTRSPDPPVLLICILHGTMTYSAYTLRCLQNVAVLLVINLLMHRNLTTYRACYNYNFNFYLFITQS